jgi:hypothetical protein
MGIEVALLAVAIGGTAFSVKQQREAAKEASSARKAQRRAEKVRKAAARKRTLAEARRRRADVIAQEAAAGGGVSTSVATGQVSSIQSQLAANLSFLNTIDTLSETAFLASGRAADAQSRAGIGQAVAGLATTGLSRTGTGTGTGT